MEIPVNKWGRIKLEYQLFNFKWIVDPDIDHQRLFKKERDKQDITYATLKKENTIYKINL